MEKKFAIIISDAHDDCNSDRKSNINNEFGSDLVMMAYTSRVNDSNPSTASNIKLLVFGIKSGSESSNEELLPEFYIHKPLFLFR